MLSTLHMILHNLDIVGIIVLILTLVPILKLMQELPNGVVRKEWKILLGLIFFFIGSYLYIAVQYRMETIFITREVIALLLFLGALFVLLVSTLSLRTALDVKRIYTLEIENITDPLMGINNRRHLERRLHDEFSKARRHNLPLSVLMLDIDHFKDVNDTYGHDTGDMVLKNLATLISTSIRDTDCVARFGGEEIVMIFPDTDGQEASKMAERLRLSIEKNAIVPADIEKEGREIYITVSIGIAENVPEVPTVEEMLKRADNAMYRAKHEGRNRIFLCDGTTTDAILPKKVESKCLGIDHDL